MKEYPLKEYSIFLFQYVRGKEKLNEFYANSKKIDDEKLCKEFEKYKFNNKFRLETIVDILEKHTLEHNKFIKINGIKSILPKYNKIIRQAFMVEIINAKQDRVDAFSSRTHAINY